MTRATARCLSEWLAYKKLGLSLVAWSLVDRVERLSVSCPGTKLSSHSCSQSASSSRVALVFQHLLVWHLVL